MIAKAFTLLEAICTISIIAALVATLTPVALRAKRAAQIQSSLQKLRQIHSALLLYQIDHDGIGRYGTASEMGLPDLTQVYLTRVGLPIASWRSSCRRNEEVNLANPNSIDFRYGPSNSQGFSKIATTFRENTAIVVDVGCDETKYKHSLYSSHRVLAVLLSGQLVNKFKPGDYNDPIWFADPEDQ